MLQPHIISLIINTQNHISSINACSTGNLWGLLLFKLGNVPHLKNENLKKPPPSHTRTTTTIWTVTQTDRAGCNQGHGTRLPPPPTASYLCEVFILCTRPVYTQHWTQPARSVIHCWLRQSEPKRRPKDRERTVTLPRQSQRVSQRWSPWCSLRPTVEQDTRAHSFPLSW